MMVLRWTTLALAALLTFAAWGDRNPAYAGFHGTAAALAVVVALAAGGRYSALFLLVFGLVDLYQAAASALGWFPAALFQYSATDDLVHWLLGTALTVVGAFGIPRRKP